MRKAPICLSKPLMRAGTDAVEVPLLGCPGGDQAATRQGRDREPAVGSGDRSPSDLALPLEVRELSQVGIVLEREIADEAPDGLSRGLVGQAPAHRAPRASASCQR